MYMDMVLLIPRCLAAFSGSMVSRPFTNVLSLSSNSIECTVKKQGRDKILRRGSGGALPRRS